MLQRVMMTAIMIGGAATAYLASVAIKVETLGEANYLVMWQGVMTTAIMIRGRPLPGLPGWQLNARP